MSDPDASPAHTAGTLAELVVVARSGTVESRHFGSLVAVDPNGSPIASGSHTGEDEHVRVARAILERA